MTSTVCALMPIEQTWAWQYDALCRMVSPEMFFYPEKERGPARRRRDERARQVCFQCPVLQQCRDYALSTREPYGVWGGMTEGERESVWLAERHGT